MEYAFCTAGHQFLMLGNILFNWKPSSLLLLAVMRIRKMMLRNIKIVNIIRQETYNNRKADALSLLLPSKQKIPHII